MKKKLWFLFFVLTSMCSYAEFYIESSKYSEITDSISIVEPPRIYGKYIVFTADSKHRYTGISFAHENYKNVHAFKKLVREEQDISVLFYIMPIPEEVSEIHYRMEIDGLWTADPVNDKEIYDFVNGFSVSVLSVPYQKEYKTSIEEDSFVKFVYFGESNQIIRLAGNFNDWDPFMYQFEEIVPGRYEIKIPLPKGVWHYAYFKGSAQIHDKTNTEHVYTRDGRMASVITVH